MKLPRRQFLYLAAGTAGLPVLVRVVKAQTYPSRPVHWIVGFAPSGGNDIVARIMGQWLSQRLGQPFVIENRPGAASTLATDVVAHALPDGYSLLLLSVNNASSASLYNNLNFNLLTDIAPVAGIGFNPLTLVVNPSVPAKTVPEFIAYVKANPGKVNMASAGTGGIGHLAGELLNMMAGINLVHVPYRGNGPALAALLGGEVQALFPSLASSAEFIRAGTLRALAVTSAMRSETLPDVPTIGEFVPGYEISTWYGIGAPKGTAADVIDKIHNEIDAGLADPKIKAQFAALGDVPMPMSPAVFGKFLADEVTKWGKVIRTADIKAE
jgi:tripartite-type tricarboxylate transporter receptor subunit TctC